MPRVVSITRSWSNSNTAGDTGGAASCTEIGGQGKFGNRCSEHRCVVWWDKESIDSSMV